MSLTNRNRLIGRALMRSAAALIVMVLMMMIGSKALAQTAAPKVTSVIGSHTWDWDLAPKYRYYYMVDYSDTRYKLTITGSSFGVKGDKCTVTIAGFSLSQTSAEIVTWTDTKIVIQPKSHLNAVPSATATVTIKRQDGKTATSAAVKLVPSISTRAYGQCTYYCAFRRLSASATIPNPSAYTSNVTVDANYVPQAKDVLMWGGAHQAYVNSVTKSILSDDKIKGIRRIQYAVDMQQYNVVPAYGEALSPYTTKAEVEETYNPKTGAILSRTLKKGYKYTDSSAGAGSGWR